MPGAHDRPVPAGPGPAAPPSSRLVLLMAAAAAVSVANLYYAQPLLAAMAASLHVPPAPLGLVTTLAQVGYALGLLLLTPLGDVRPRRDLIVALLLAGALPLAAEAAAPTLPALAAASFMVGILTVTPQVIVPLAAALSPDASRGRTVGTVMSGLLIGILLARTASGAVAAALGWRAVFWIASGAGLALAAVLRRALPREDPPVRASYGRLLLSLARLAREEPVLRQSALTGGAMFGAFSVFWTTSTFYLAGPPWHLGPARIGLLGLAGLAGASVAPLAGRLADRRGPRPIVGASLLTALLAFGLLAVFRGRLWGVAAGATVLDLGVQAGQISNQTRIYALLPDGKSRVNTVYMVGYFCGGAVGSGLGALAWHAGGWRAALAAGALLLAAGLAAHVPRRGT